jgi:hypothetical protein
MHPIPAMPHDPGPAFPPTDLLAAGRRMLPWLLLTWLAALLLPGPRGQQVFLVVGLSPFIAAAAARGLDLHPGWNVPALAVQRAFSHLTTFLPLLVLVALAAAVGGTLGSMLAHLTRLPDDRILSMPFAALATFPILWWYWPATVIAYVVPEDAGFRIGGGRAWRGPRYGDARHLVRAGGRARPAALLLGTFYLWTALLLVVGDYRGGAPLATLVEAASYLLFIPLLIAMAVTETRRMLARAHGRS